MTTTDGTVGASSDVSRVPSLARRALRVVDAIAGSMALVSGVVFLLAALYITLDVVARNFLGFSSAATDEMGGYALALGGMWALAYTLRTGGHVRIDVLLPHLPRLARVLLNYAAMAVMAFFATIVAVYMSLLAADSYAGDARAMSFLRTPLFVPQGLIAVGLGVLAVEAVVLLAVGIVESVASRRLIDIAGGGEAEADGGAPPSL